MFIKYANGRALAKAIDYGRQVIRNFINIYGMTKFLDIIQSGKHSNIEFLSGASRCCCSAEVPKEAVGGAGEEAPTGQ